VTRVPRILSRLAALLLLVACNPGSASEGTPAKRAHAAAEAGQAVATFAGGCFWCMEGPFDELPGVVSTTSGYTGGHVEKPSYEQVSSGRTGHTEAVQVVYDPAKVGYEKLLEVFWHNIDPLTKDAQFCDHGPQYRSGIFVHDAEQRRLAQATKRELESSKRLPGPIVTEIAEVDVFYPAEAYHQDYYRKNPLRYRYYRSRCGRDARLKSLWGDDAPSH